jgi:hypothetical protein
MRTIEEVKAELREVYTTVHMMLEHWQKEFHQQFMAEMWNIHDLRQELTDMTGSRENASHIVKEIYESIFHPS